MILTENVFAKVLFWVVLTCAFSMGCNSAKQANSSKSKVEKQSIAAKLEANNHLPIAERIALYHRLKKENPKAYNFEEESELNIYGYSLLQKKRATEAIEIFKLNVELFPESANVYDSLADAYREIGDKERTEINFEKAQAMWSLLDADSTWGREIFQMPLGFAPKIAYKGIEEARFAPGWGDSTHTHFWTYAFAWEIDLTTQPSTADLEGYMKAYFDGLMEGRNRNNEILIKTTAEFKASPTKKDRYMGKLMIFEGFRTMRPLALNVVVDYAFCKRKQTSQILFRFSPQQFEHAVWSEMEAIKFKAASCQTKK